MKETFVAEVDVKNKIGYLAEAVTRGVLQKKRSEIFGKNHRKAPVQESFLACRRETLLKKETPVQVFLL